jgi:endothelin-converting enzyme/putative endopeptidase
VQWADEAMGEALGQLFVSKNFPPETKQATVAMVKNIESIMADRLAKLDWMGAATRKQALLKLEKLRNKIGYPDKWRDYGKIKISQASYTQNDMNANAFELERRLDRIGGPVDRAEWEMTPPTVNAYYNPSMNDMNFPAGVLQPPLFDMRLDLAPSYGNTGATVGHELIHGFDDEGRKFDAAGNLEDWWTKEDASAFEKRAKCVTDQYATYTVIDDIKINSKLTLGEDLADFAGTILAYEAWRKATATTKLEDKDGLTPAQRFFVGFAQWDCANERPENLRLHAKTNPHSPPKYRINGVVVNMPEFAQAFRCPASKPMVKPEVCRVW